MKTLKKYIAVEFISGASTTTGQPNPKTGRMSHAVNLAVFSKKINRDEWVKNGDVTSAMSGNCRRSVSSRDARSLCLGDSVQEYTEYIEMILDITILE